MENKEKMIDEGKQNIKESEWEKLKIEATNQAEKEKENVKEVQVMLERCNTDVPKMHEEDKPSCVENVAEEVKEFVEQFLQDEKKVEKSNIQNLKPMQFIQRGKQESVPAVILKKIKDGSYDVNFFMKTKMGWIKNELVQNVKAEDVCLIDEPEEIKLSSRQSMFKFDLWSAKCRKSTNNKQMKKKEKAMDCSICFCMKMWASNIGISIKISITVILFSRVLWFFSDFQI